MKLEIELVPKTCWFSNLRKELSKDEWDVVRRHTYSLSPDHSCMICGNPIGRLSAHEIWDYDEINHIQKLVGMIALCDDCHNVKHIGYAQICGKYEDAANHFCKVNECSSSVFNKAMEKAVKDFQRRSMIQDWQLDISYLKDNGFEDIYNNHIGGK